MELVNRIAKSLSVFVVAAVALTLAASVTPTNQAIAEVDEHSETIAVHKVFDPNTIRWLFTTDAVSDIAFDGSEANWIDEGVAWYAPKDGAPVYRVCNPFNGNRHYTEYADERDGLIALGWVDEGICWYSDTNKEVPVYCAYNSNSISDFGTHYWTTSETERDGLVRIGWSDEEGATWYASAAGDSGGGPLAHANEVLCVLVLGTNLSFNGAKREPAVEVVTGTKRYLVSAFGSSRFNVEYSNNVNVGIATVKVSGIGDFYGEAETTFEITPSSNTDSITERAFEPSVQPEVHNADWYRETVEAFVGDPRWSDGVSWGDDQEVKLSPATGWFQCAAYVADFAKYVFNEDLPTKGAHYEDDASQIRAGDVLSLPGHWIVVLERDGASLRTAEGNFNHQVRIGWGHYYIEDGNIRTRGVLYQNFGGWHYNTSYRGLMPTEVDDSGVNGERFMHRLYNPYSGEHFYTSNKWEADETVYCGWDYEGIGWNAPEEGDPVYRLYNSYAGEHHYTPDASERDSLVAAGWTDEGVGWLAAGEDGMPLYREYNPYMFSCNHNYTADKAEHDNLVSLGWHNEGIAWYGV